VSPGRAGFLLRAACVVAASLLLAGLFSHTTLYPRLSWWLEDLQQRAFARQLPLDHVIVIDVDEASMQRLEPKNGPWPYRRDVYARAMRFFTDNGARAVVFDILFSEAREGDAALSEVLDRRSVLAAAALPYALRRQPAYHIQLAGVALPRVPFHAVQKAPAWPDLTLPLPQFTRATEARVGVISTLPDDDGLVRRLPLVHRAYGETLPSLPFAALLAAEPGAQVTAAAGELRAGGRDWPTFADGSVSLRYPSNAGALSVLPFHELTDAMAGAPGTSHIADLVRGKIVFVGSSSAVLGDFAYTPVGRLPGLQLSALMTELLLENQVRRPALAWLDALLAALALALPVALMRLGGTARPRDFAAGALSTLVVVAGAGIALLLANQHSAWLFALLSGAAAHAGALAAWLLALQQERQRLHYEAVAAQEASRMKTEFLNQMTHELRTPITAIMGFNKINQFTDELGREQRTRNSTIIGRNCEHLLALINNNLDLARIEAGQLAVEGKPENFAALLEEVVATLRVMAEQKGLALKLSVTGWLPLSLVFDAFRLRQVLMNLLGNAIKFTERGTVAVEAQWQAGELLITVRDTGIGIPVESLSRVFEAYQRAVGGRITGSGLGLTITRKLVELMGGSIRVASIPDGGSTFEVRIKAPVAAPAVAPAGQTWPPDPVEPLGGRLLIVEDSGSMRDLLEAWMRVLKTDCQLVGNGLDAVEAALGADFDAVLMDMEMPLMDGYEAVRVLRERGYAKPIIAFTAHQTGPEVQRALREGCSGILSKPLTIEQLRETLAPLLAKAQARTA
jgi:signal transduction histidine kinase/CheY-like chemotaxis protein